MKNVVYTDASFSGEHRNVAIGGFVSENNSMVVQFSNKIDYAKVKDNNIAELYAIENGLLLAKARGITELKLFSDSKVSTRYLQYFLSLKREDHPSKMKLFKKDRAVCLRLFFLVNFFKKIIVEHVMRRFNGIANILSKLVLSRKSNDYARRLQGALVVNQNLTGEIYV